MDQKKMLLGYRIAAGVAILSALLPWARATGSSNIMGNVSSTSASVGGMSTAWGTLTLLAGIAAVALSFVKPASFIKDKTRTAMAGIGGVVLLLAIIGSATAASRFGEGVHYSDAYGNRASSSAGASIGVYLALLCGGAMAALGWLVNWDEQP